jgi:RNA polymerase sigma factor (sigma-70 family)
MMTDMVHTLRRGPRAGILPLAPRSPRPSRSCATHCRPPDARAYTAPRLNARCGAGLRHPHASVEFGLVDRIRAVQDLIQGARSACVGAGATEGWPRVRLKNLGTDPAGLLRVDKHTGAIEDLYRRRYLAFRNGIAPLAGNYEAARDVVQEAFARALRDRAGYRGEVSLEAWVWKIAIRAALDLRRNGDSVHLEESLRDAALPQAERNPALADAVKCLPPRQRLIVFLRYFADLSYADIATACAISEGTVAAALAQARGSLLEVLKQQEVEP